MPQFNPVVTPDYLAKMGSVSPLYALQADNAFQRAQTQDQYSLGDLVNEQASNQQMRPLKVQAQQIDNDTGLARLPGIKAESSMSQRKDKMGSMTFDSEVSAKLKELALSRDKSELEGLTVQAQRMMLSQNPQERAQGQRLFDASAHMYELRRKHEQDMEKIRVNNGSAEKIMQMQIDAGRFDKKAGTIKTLEQAIDNAKSARERHQMLIDAATKARQEGNNDLAEQYEYRAEKIRPQAEAELQAQPKPGQVDPSKLGGGGIPVTPPISIAPPQQAAPAAAGQYTQGQTYKGKTGTYQYLGGDPKDKNSWKKVN